jgi:hypothetical protein
VEFDESPDRSLTDTGGRPPGNGASGGGTPNGVGGLPRSFSGLNESVGMAIFADYRQLGSYMSGLSSHLKTMLIVRLHVVLSRSHCTPPTQAT